MWALILAPYRLKGHEVDNVFIFNDDSPRDIVEVAYGEWVEYMNAAELYADEPKDFPEWINDNYNFPCCEIEHLTLVTSGY